jgi:HEAT repeat protein
VVFTNEDARSREFAAWWLRRRTFSLSWVVRMFRETLEGSYTHAQISRIQAARTAAGLQPIPEATLRARAAEALGEILVPSAAAPLQVAATRDPEVIVRLAAVGAIGRLNHTMSGTVLAQALGDADASVRQVALKNVLLVNSFRDRTSLVGALADADAANRREAALLVGELRVEAAVPALGGLVRGDEDASVRRAAAWALGRIGTGEARTTLTEVAASEADRGVLDAIEIARQMR